MTMSSQDFQDLLDQAKRDGRKEAAREAAEQEPPQEAPLPAGLTGTHTYQLLDTIASHKPAHGGSSATPARSAKPKHNMIPRRNPAREQPRTAHGGGAGVPRAEPESAILSQLKAMQKQITALQSGQNLVSARSAAAAFNSVRNEGEHARLSALRFTAQEAGAHCAIVLADHMTEMVLEADHSGNFAEALSKMCANIKGDPELASVAQQITSIVSAVRPRTKRAKLPPRYSRPAAETREEPKPDPMLSKMSQFWEAFAGGMGATRTAAAKSCNHCGAGSHNENRCWKKYPHLAPQGYGAGHGTSVKKE